MKKTFIAIASILAIVAGCAKNDVQPKAVKATVQVSMEEAQTRATLNTETKYQNFETTDQLAIYDGESVKCFTLASGEGTKNAVFTSTTPLATAEKYYAVYPYGSNITGSDNVIDMAFYSSYINYDEVICKAEGGNNIMAAISTDGTFSLKNVCSYILFDIQSYATDHIVKSIVISDPDDKYIAGWATLTFDDSGDVAVAIKTGAEYSAEKTITINCGSSGISTSTLKPFIIAVPPVFANGFNMTVNFAEGEPLVLSTNTPVGRNQVVTMPAIEFDAPEVVEVNGRKYSSIYKGIRAANATNADVNVKLLADITDIQDSIEVTNAAGKLTTLDLNGHTLSCLAEGVNKTVFAKTDLTICDSSISADGGITGLHCAVLANKGKLTINGGNFNGDGLVPGGSGVIYSYGDGSKLTITGGSIKCTNATDAGRAINVTGAGEITGGTITCDSPTGFAIRAYNTIELTINGSDVVVYSNSNDNAPLYAASTSSRIAMVDGYVYSAGTAEIVNSVSKVSITGGRFNKAVTAATGYQCFEDAATGPDGRSYTHKVEEMTDPILSVTIGSTTTEYYTYEEAYSAVVGASDDVTMKLNASLTLTGVQEFTNTNGKKVTIDLNGKNIFGTTTKSCFIRTTGELTLTDSSTGTPGTISSNGFRVIEPADNAVVNIKKISVTSSRGGVGNTGADSSLIVITKNATVNVSDNATVFRAAKNFKLFYVKGTLNIGECEMYVGNADANGYNLMYVLAGCKVTINEGACLRSYGDTGMLRSGGSTASIVINGGYFYANTIYSTGTTDSYAAAFKMNGGYYSTDVTQIKAVKENASYGEGLSFQSCSSVAYNWHGETLEFTYTVKAKPE